MKAILVSTLMAGIGFALAPAAHAHDSSGNASGSMPHFNVVAPLGGGVVRTYVVLAPAEGRGRLRKPQQLGVEIPSSVMQNLPAEDAAMAIDFPMPARGTPFQYMMLDWNAHGHEPVGIYDKPHFDFHFYMQDLEEVMNIKPGPCSGLDCEDYQKAMKPVPMQFVPEGYINVGSAVPYMGNHLIDPASPEFNGQPFTRTWLYGAYDGEITFYEPMITRASLVDTPDQCAALKLPAAYRESGYYPTKYCTEFDKQQSVYRVYLTDFVYRSQP